MKAVSPKLAAGVLARMIAHPVAGSTSPSPSSATARLRRGWGCAPLFAAKPTPTAGRRAAVSAIAATPDGKTIPLINIPKWDFRWQYFYTFPKMVKVPKGSTIAAIAVYDNTANNPNNPFSPPRTVIGTNGSMCVTDEMFQFIMRYLPYKPGDENISLDSSGR